MKSVKIVGCGTGPGSMTLDGAGAIAAADVLFGAPRLLEPYRETKKTCPCYLGEEIRKELERENYEKPVVLVSGDTGFFSAASKLIAFFSSEEVEVIPGISSMAAFFARLQRPWQETAAMSLHGRGGNFVDLVRRSRQSFFLLGPDKNQAVAQLCEAGFEDLSCSAGENLGLENEAVYHGKLKDLFFQDPASLSVLVVDNPGADSRVPCGIPDGRFLRGRVPMTKAEVRAVVLSKLNLRPEATALDIGAGTGSVAIEMAYAAWRGKVYAIERNPEGVELIEKNRKRHHLGNLEILPGEATDVLHRLPPADAAFIGGSGGRLKEIIRILREQNAAMRIVVTAISLETLEEARACLAVEGCDPEIVQIAVSRCQPAGRYHLLKAENPIFVLSGGGV